MAPTVDPSDWSEWSGIDSDSGSTMARSRSVPIRTRIRHQVALLAEQQAEDLADVLTEDCTA